MDSTDTVSTDVLIVGGGPSGLAAAIHLADSLKKRGIDDKRIMLIEKGNAIGSHNLSGAVIDPKIFKTFLPDVDISEIPLDSEVTVDKTMFLTETSDNALPFHPPYMNNIGNYSASISKLCKYLAQIAEDKGVEIYSGFAVEDVIYKDGKVSGVKTKDTGVDHHGKNLKNFQEGTTVEAAITILAEGTRGSVAKKVIDALDLDTGCNEQIYSLGVKELWSVPEGNIEAGTVYHTMGYPLQSGSEFGGGFIYGLEDNKVALGLVVGLDYKDPSFDVHAAMQVWKQHPFVSKILEGGTIQEFGAKTLPEGGYYAMPKFYDDNLMIVGDSAGFLTTARLKGIHLAIESGMMAAKAAAKALVSGDTSKASLSYYNELFEQSNAYEEMYRARNFRQAFDKGMLLGGLQFATQLITGGAGVLGRLRTEKDSEVLMSLNAFTGVPFAQRFEGKLEFDKKFTFDKVTDVFYSKANHEEEQLCHLVLNNPENYNKVNIEQYGCPEASFCPAEVYELHTDKEGHKELRIHAENCVHCKTCDIKSPAAGITWVVPYGGDGPDYEYM
ncbi:MAG: electron transfer flavoprotein-ubiquinone oxidoreductase [Sulfurovum sp.]|nr:MAG: electron transfer flavoprotein-ubiquinone oxidoreductase [Sulfurovum sp.]